MLFYTLSKASHPHSLLGALKLQQLLLSVAFHRSEQPSGQGDQDLPLSTGLVNDRVGPSSQDSNKLPPEVVCPRHLSHPFPALRGRCFLCPWLLRAPLPQGRPPPTQKHPILGSLSRLPGLRLFWSRERNMRVRLRANGLEELAPGNHVRASLIPRPAACHLPVRADVSLSTVSEGAVLHSL